jgi:putative ABC transport system ATP-binding protein
LIRIENLEFRYGEGDFRLGIARLDVERGASVAFVGPSGSGKTTLLNLIAGIALPRSGLVETDGVEVSSLSDVERREFRITRVGLVFQEFELLDYLSVLDNILLPYRIHPALQLDHDARRRAVTLAEQVGIADKLRRHPRNLSQGERQRVAVCRAVLPGPKLLLADEPTGNLDPVNTDRVLDILFDYAASSEATLLTVTHDRELLGRFERIVDLKEFQEAGDAGRAGPATAGDGGGAT